MLTYAPDPVTADEVIATAEPALPVHAPGHRRQRGDGRPPPRPRARGVERLYAWFTDFADEANLARFGDEVLSPLR